MGSVIFVVNEDCTHAHCTGFVHCTGIVQGDQKVWSLGGANCISISCIYGHQVTKRFILIFALIFVRILIFIAILRIFMVVPLIFILILTLNIAFLMVILIVILIAIPMVVLILILIIILIVRLMQKDLTDTCGKEWTGRSQKVATDSDNSLLRQLFRPVAS